MASSSLQAFFTPAGVAIIGASREPTKLGYGLARNLIQSGYPGAIHFVNPKGGELMGKPIYPSIDEVPDPVELAVVLAPAPQVAETLRACGERGLRAVIVASGGFRETGPEGAALEAGILEVARHYNMRLVGPNCIGISDTHTPLDTTFVPPPMPAKGEVAFVSHSGAICAAIIDWIRGQGIGLSALVSLGNQVDLNETDLLDHFGGDPNTRVITLYLEGIGNGPRFVETAVRVSREKPILALKVGRFAAGQRAAASHTGALAGSETGYQAAFERGGVIRADTLEEMFHWARALAWCPLPKGRNVAVLTNAGGPGVTAADSLEQYGMKMATFQEATTQALKTFLPAAGSFHNPVDMLASASPEHYARSLSILLADPGVDSVMVIIPVPPMFKVEDVADAVIAVVKTTNKPVVVALMGETLIQGALARFREARIPDYRFSETAASALAVLYRRTETLARLEENAAMLQKVSLPALDRFLEGQIPGQFLNQEAAIGLMEAYGLPVVKIELAKTAQEAVLAAGRLGYPVVLKVASPDIPHKSDVGGVLLNLSDAQAVAHGFDLVVSRARQAKPDAVIEGVHLQRMLPPGQEVILGVVQDPQFGPLVMFGSGGVEVEGLKDVAFALAPVNRLEAERLIEKTWAGRKLSGYRNIPPADREAVLEALVRLSQLAAENPRIAEIEINPLRALPTGQGACAVDVRARLEGAAR